MQPTDIFLSGLETLQEYVSAHILTCLIPAFFIAGAIAVFISKQSLLKYFGTRTKKYISYPIASISGAILAVCSCTVLPLFAGIHKRGGGIGPATTFLFSGPAINILAVILTARVLGLNIGIARIISAIFLSIFIGLLMAFIFKESGKENSKENEEILVPSEEQKRPLLISFVFFLLLIAILIIGAASSEYVPLIPKLAIISILITLLVILLRCYYQKEEIREWGKNTGNLMIKLFPILLIGVFIVGIIEGVGMYLIPSSDPQNAIGIAVAPYLNSNSIISCLIASIIGAILYMPTLLEVAIVGNLFGYSSGLMGSGPALSLLLAGPSLSLPNMLVITKVLGVKKAGAYVFLVVLGATGAGFIYGMISG